MPPHTPISLHALVRAMNSGGAERGKTVRGPLTSQRRCLSKHKYKQLGRTPWRAGGVWETRRLRPGPGQLTVLSVRQAVRPQEEIPV